MQRDRKLRDLLGIRLLPQTVQADDDGVGNAVPIGDAKRLEAGRCGGVNDKRLGIYERLGLLSPDFADKPYGSSHRLFDVRRRAVGRV